MRKETIKKINQANVGDHIGSIVMWSVKEVAIQHKDLKALAEIKKLPERFLPPETDEVKAFRNATQIIRRSSKAKGFLFRTIYKENKNIMIGVVEETVWKERHDLEYGVDCKIKLHNGIVEIEGSDSRELGKEVKKLYQQMFKLAVTQDIIYMLKNAMYMMAGISLRDNGGVYFVPPYVRDDLNKLQATLNEIGITGEGEVELTILEINSSAQSKASMGKQIKHSLEEQLSLVEKKIEQYTNGDLTPHEDTLLIKIEEFKNLKDQSNFYADLLKIKVSKLHQGIEDADAVLKDLLGVTQEKNANKKRRKPKKEKFTKVYARPII